MRALALFTTLGFFVIGCGGDGPTEDPGPGTVTVTVSPASTTVGAGGSQLFTATVTGGEGDGVNWSTTGGTLSAAGNQATLTAPIEGGTITVTATSQAQSSATGSATVTVTPVVVQLSGGESDLLRGEARTFTAQVSGTAETGVEWQASCGELSASASSAVLVAPADDAGPCQVTATSTLNPAVSAVASFRVLPDWVVTVAADPAELECTLDDCSFRAALDRVLSGQGPVGEDGVAVIRMHPALAGATLTLTATLPSVDGRQVRILGPEDGPLTLDAGATPGDPRGILEIGNGGEVEAARLIFTGGISPHGGAIRVHAGGSLHLRDSRITGNRGLPGRTAGGVVIDDGSAALLENTHIEQNFTEEAGAPGGGIAVLAGSSLEMIGGTISGNRTGVSAAGGILVADSEVVLDGVEVSGNESANTGGALFAAGAAKVTLRGVLAEGNRAAIDAGFGRFNATGAVRIEESVFRNNEAISVGGVLSVGSTTHIVLSGSTLEGNEGDLGGGAIYGFEQAVIEIEGSVFQGNRGGGVGGGAIQATGETSVTATESHFLANRAESAVARGGALAFMPGTRLDLRASEVADNVLETDGFGGGALYIWNAMALLDDVEIHGNSVVGGLGGGVAIFNAGNVQLVDVLLEGNQATGAGGALFTQHSIGSMERVTVRDNESELQTGGLQFLDGGEWVGRQVVVEGNRSIASVGGIGVFGSARVHLEESMIRNNEAGTSSGGIRFDAGSGAHLELYDVELRGNRAVTQAGGGTFAGEGTALLQRLTVADNVSEGSVGGVVLANPGVVLTHSSVVDNVAETAWGGGIHLGGGAQIHNTTVSGNRAQQGGGVHLTTGGGLLNGVTLVGNVAEGEGGGVRVLAAASLVNVLLSGNTLEGGAAANCFRGEQGAATPALGHNLSDDASCTGFLGHATDLHDEPAGVDPAWSIEGGAPPFHPLLEGSAAIGAGSPDHCAETDQRGFGRKVPCDIGAYEFGGSAPSGGSLAAPAALRPANPEAEQLTPGGDGAPGQGRGGAAASGVAEVHPAAG